MKDSGFLVFDEKSHVFEFPSISSVSKFLKTDVDEIALVVKSGEPIKGFCVDVFSQPVRKLPAIANAHKLYDKGEKASAVSAKLKIGYGEAKLYQDIWKRIKEALY